MNKKIIAVMTAFTVVGGMLMPVYAEDTADISSEPGTVITADMTATDNTAVTDALPEETAAESEISEDDMTEDSGEMVDTVAESVDEAASETSEGAGSIADDTLLEDDAEYLAADWYEWDAATGTLTLKNQLPEMSDIVNKGLADLAGINPNNILKIVILPGTKAGKNSTGLFSEMRYLTDIRGIDELDTSNVEKMIGMFYNCRSLKSLDLRKWNTGKVTSMSAMFFGCAGLESVEIIGWKTQNVAYMSAMFAACHKLKTVDLSSLDTRNVLNFADMFARCTALESVDVSDLDTSSALSLEAMFNDCQSLSSLDVSNWDTGNVKNMSLVFSYCYNITALDLRKWDTSHVTDMSSMFRECNVSSLDLSSFDTSNVNECEAMFYRCSSLTTITVSEKWVMPSYYAEYMFTGCTQLKGGAGTVYESGKGGLEYACIDEGESRPGYFTSSTIAKPTLVIKTAFGGKTVQFNCTDPDVEIYYQTGSSNISLSSKHVKAGTTVFFNTPMTGADAAIYFKTYWNGQWSPVAKWGLLNVKIAKPLIVQSGKKTENNFKVYTQTKDSYIVYTLDGSTPAIEEGTSTLNVKNGRIVWGTSAVINVPKGRTIKAIAIRSGLVTSDVMEYSNK